MTSSALFQYLLDIQVRTTVYVELNMSRLRYVDQPTPPMYKSGSTPNHFDGRIWRHGIYAKPSSMQLSHCAVVTKGFSTSANEGNKTINYLIKVAIPSLPHTVGCRTQSSVTIQSRPHQPSKPTYDRYLRTASSDLSFLSLVAQPEQGMSSFLAGTWSGSDPPDLSTERQSQRDEMKQPTRAPQQLKSRFNIGEHTKDAVYIDAERRFVELETETKKLHDESKKYFDAINAMLQHQLEFSKAIQEIYKPISGRVSDPDSMKIEGNPEGIRACEEYEAVVKDLQETLAPELEMIENRVIRPATELLDVIKAIRKTSLKREHKRLDYDRRRATLKKLQEKKERNAKDEKAIWKAEGDVETATQEFNYFNDLLKEELPKLFALEQEFIRPLFQSFYYMQLNVFYTLHEKMQGCDIGYFDLTLDIEEAFHSKRGDVVERAEALSIVKFKTTGQKRPAKYGRPNALEGPKATKLLTAGPSSSTAATTSAATPPPAVSPSPALKFPAYSAVGKQQPDGDANPPPPYSPAQGSAVSPGLAALAASKPKPPPPKPKPSRLSSVPAPETAAALYDYDAQVEGDLSFRAGDVIEIVNRTQNDNEWWTGKLNGKQGQFPGNYVQVNPR
ncbi:BAR-domain-containing protein [Sodiomyces alkalinus F11]|uniref:BAR-domain-containing protein n=1 Tax=Sodiomyces alkalinus (strain CBS 110278 / VKM F-3762 / F11) TaxID=1314773 RepID=A0A3N2PT98_SODAK|nr:BAR-domain-containing protein [Sodiomyces alkalinus F11]ROT37745.1 BAR-domain-containing protein [Sodiomyces alkalinus F11]